MVLHPQFSPELYLEGVTSRQTMLSKDHHGPRAILNALARLTDSYKTQSDATTQDLAIAQAQIRDYESRLGDAFPHEAYLSELTALRDRLRAGLSARTPEAGNEPQVSVSELAAQIKAVRAAYSIEAAPQRTGQRQTSAEEPVTLRIRRRAEAVPASNAAGDPDATAFPADTFLPPGEWPAPTVAEQMATIDANEHHPGAVEIATHEPELTYQEQVAMSRRRKEYETSIF